MLRRCSACVLLVLLVSVRAFAQTPVANPTALDFTPSPDHSAVFPVSGQPKVTGYRALYYPAAACAPTCPTTPPAFIISLGKPTPTAGKILVSNVFGGIVLNTLYKAVVVADGPGGASVYSNVAGPFGNEQLTAPAAATDLAVKGGS